jgi:hypothetical protein
VNIAERQPGCLNKVIRLFLFLGDMNNYFIFNNFKKGEKMKRFEVFVCVISILLVISMRSYAANPVDVLKSMGYYVKSLEGKLDDKTVDYIKAFQKDNGLPESGAVDDATIKKLSEYDALVGKSAFTVGEKAYKAGYYKASRYLMQKLLADANLSTDERTTLHHTIALSAKQEGQHMLAFEHLWRYTQLKPSDKEESELLPGYGNQAISQYNLSLWANTFSGKPVKGISDIAAQEKAVKEKMPDTFLRGGLEGLRDLWKGEKKDAIEKFGIAIDSKDLTDFQKAVVCFERSKVYESMGDKGNAIADMETFVKLAPYEKDGVKRLESLRK